MAELPAGTVTFLFTDLEGSTQLWELHPDAMSRALARHDAMLRDVVVAHRGIVVKTTGDGMHAVFRSAQDAVEAAVEAQGHLATTEWEGVEPLKVRMGIHTGETEVRDGDYYGGAVNRAARLMGIAHGGQVVLSATSAALVDEGGFEWRDLGQHRLVGLARTEHVWQVDAPAAGRDFPPLRSLDARAGNLPRQMTSFVGRETVSDEVRAHLRERRLVTLTGVGGVGKTRVALKVAEDMAEEFPDGTWYCELAALTEPEAIWQTLASVFRLTSPAGGGFDELVLDFLRPKHLLLVLDNCEHLLDTVAGAVHAIRARCGEVAVLATSREGLAIRGEQIVAIPSLDLPAPDVGVDEIAHAEAIALFCERAHDVRSDFALTVHNASTVVELCRRLDGIPLAIELAAARAGSLTAEDIVERLDQRFKLLTSGGRAALERHQTLRSTIDWSYQLLDERARSAFDRLSVFAGGCRLDAAEAVLGHDELDRIDVVEVVGQLVDKSLVLAEPGADGRLRYRQLESIRQYARDRLESRGASAATRRRHADHFVALADAAGRGLRSEEQLRWARTLVHETGNLRAAFDWALEAPSADHALRLVASLAVDRVPTSNVVLAWAELALEVPGARDHAQYIAVCFWATHSAMRRGDLVTAERYVAAIDDEEARRGTGSTHASAARALLAMSRADLDAALVEAGTWVERARRDHDDLELSGALMVLSLVQSATGRHDLARALADEGLEVARVSGVPSALAGALMLTPWSLLEEDPDRARDLFEEAVVVGTEIGDESTVVFALTGRGVSHASAAQWQRALDDVREATDRIVQLGTLAGHMGGTLGVAAVVLTALGHWESGAVVLGASYRYAPAAYQRPEQLRQVARDVLVDQLGPERYDAYFERGRSLDAHDALSTLVAALDETG